MSPCRKKQQLSAFPRLLPPSSGCPCGVQSLRIDLPGVIHFEQETSTFQAPLPPVLIASKPVSEGKSHTVH